MSKRSREARKQVKRLLRFYGVRENEFGELAVKITKAEARRRLLRRFGFRQAAQEEIFQEVSRRAMGDICALEDARVLETLSQYVG